MGPARGVVGRRVQRGAPGVGDHEHVPVRPDPGGDGVHHVAVVADVHVRVHAHHELEEGVRGERGHGGVLGVAVDDRVHLDVADVAGAAAGRHVHGLDPGAGDAAGVVDVAVAGHPREQQVVRVAHEGALVERALPHGHGLDIDHRVDALGSVGAGVLAEGRLLLHFGGVDLAFQHDLRAGRHLHVDGLALHQLHRPAEHGPGDAELVGVDGGEAQVADVHGRVAADDRGHLRGPAPGLVLLEDVVAVGGLRDLDAEAVPALQLQAVDAGVADARVRVLHHVERQRDVTPGVQLVVLEDGQPGDVHVVAGEHHFVARRRTAVHHHRRQRVGLAPAVLVDEVRGRGVVGQPDGHGQPRKAGVHVGHQRDGGPLDVLEDHAGKPLLPFEPGQDPRHLEHRVHLPGHPQDLVGIAGFEKGDGLPEGLAHAVGCVGRHGRTLNTWLRPSQGMGGGVVLEQDLPCNQISVTFPQCTRSSCRQS